MLTRDRRPPYLHRIVPMSVCANLGFDRPSRLAVYAGYVVLRVHLCASMRTRDRRPPYLHRMVPMSMCANFQTELPFRVDAYSEQHRTGQRPF
jgi:hypothetical protein